MKKVLLSLAILGSISLFSSCEAIKKKVKEEANVDINFGYDGADATIEIPIINQTNVTTYPDTASMPNNVQEQIQQANDLLTMQNIEKVIVTGASLKFNNCDAQNNASNFRTAMIAFYSNTNPDLKWIATNDEVPDVNGEEIPLVVDENINLKEYLTSSTQIYYITGVNMRRPTTKVLNATLKISYKLIGNTGYGE